MRKLLMILCLSALSYGIFAGCLWTWTYNECQTTQCSEECSPSSNYFNKYYCQVVGNYCCTCWERNFTCGPAPCNPIYKSVRVRYEREADLCERYGSTSYKCLTYEPVEPPG